MIRIVLSLAALLALATPAAAQYAPCSVGYLACGQDFSANAASVPLPGYVLLTTVPPALRGSLEVQNQSTDPIQVVRDDGFGNQVTSIMLAAAAATGGQGGSWSSTTFRGRIRVYAPSSSDRVAVFQE